MKKNKIERIELQADTWVPPLCRRNMDYVRVFVAHFSSQGRSQFWQLTHLYLKIYICLYGSENPKAAQVPN